MATEEEFVAMQWMESSELSAVFATTRIPYVNTGDLLNDAIEIVENAQKFARSAVNYSLVMRNWLLGERIIEEDFHGDRAEYGAQVIKQLSKDLKKTYGSGFDASNLYRFVKFYEYYPEIFDAASRKLPILSWTHYRALIQIHDKLERDWYEREALREVWSFRTLQRNISSQYYHRLLKSQDQRPVKEEMQSLTSRYQQDKLEFIKNPVIAEFLGISEETSYRESDLEQFIINNLQVFMMELGKGYAFVARQQHIRTEKEDYYIPDFDSEKAINADVTGITGFLSFLILWLYIPTFSILR